ncbi:MAG: hypothetical protein GY718_10075 [Lentisphaerae bacterium]|nr:hypothetical protein [Lentisphaerota bacterium]
MKLNRLNMADVMEEIECDECGHNNWEVCEIYPDTQETGFQCCACGEPGPIMKDKDAIIDFDDYL